MTTTDYIIAAILVLLVIPQVRGVHLRSAQPRAADHSGHRPAPRLPTTSNPGPTQGNDVVLDVLGLAAGLILGIACGLTTRLFRDREGFMVARAGLVAAFLWIVGMASRTGFEYAATHNGAHAIADFSRGNSITGADAWTAALLLMALAQVLARTATIRIRARMIDSDRRAALARA